MTMLFPSKPCNSVLKIQTTHPNTKHPNTKPTYKPEMMAKQQKHQFRFWYQGKGHSPLKYICARISHSLSNLLFIPRISIHASYLRSTKRVTTTKASYLICDIRPLHAISIPNASHAQSSQVIQSTSKEPQFQARWIFFCNTPNASRSCAGRFSAPSRARS